MNPEMCPEDSYRPAVTVNILPDNIFREIFAFCLSDIVATFYDYFFHMAEWKRLVQVCQRWRQIIYGSPRYLDLHLYSSYVMPFRKSLSLWPDFPLILVYSIFPDDESNDLIAALEHPNRVHHLHLIIKSWDSEVFEKMRVPFPALTDLDFTGPDWEHGKDVYDISNNFLGNAAPCLQHLHLDGMSFHGLPDLLLSTRSLVSLQLEDMPALFYGGYGYISPKAMARGLAGLTRLRTLFIKFRFPGSVEGLEKGRRLDPPMREALPSLTEFAFSGESKYLEVLMARIDMPSVEDIEIVYFPLGVELEVCQLSQFVGRAANLELAHFRRAKGTFGVSSSHIKLDRPSGERHQVRFSVGAEISKSVWVPYLDVLVPCMARALSQLTALLTNVVHLSFDSQTHLHKTMNRLDNSKLRPLLHLFPTLEELNVSGVLAGHIATMLENIAEERVIDVMPALHSLWLSNDDEPVGSTERFLSLRQLSGRPVTVRNTDDQSEDEDEFDG